MKSNKLPEHRSCPSLNGFVHSCIASAINSLSRKYLFDVATPLLVVDATCGNGHDTLFLAQNCASAVALPKAWRVLAFDIQAQACTNTHQRIEGAGFSDNVTILQKSHVELVHYLQPDGVCGVIMFNLGYLPGSDKKMITSALTTLPALEVAASSLFQGGVLSAHCYGGHAGGSDEMQAVEQWFASLPYPEWRVMTYSICNKSINPEAVYFAQKCFCVQKLN